MLSIWLTQIERLSTKFTNRLDAGRLARFTKLSTKLAEILLTKLNNVFSRRIIFIRERWQAIKKFY